MIVLSTFLETSLIFLFCRLKKTVQNLVQSGRKAVSNLKKHCKIKLKNVDLAIRSI